MKKEYDFSKGKRGPIVAPAKGQTRVTLRLDDEVLEWFRQQVHEAGGASYQTLINEALRAYIGQQRETLEQVMRRIVREELRKVAQKLPNRKAA